jgi:hypothetical protein
MLELLKFYAAKSAASYIFPVEIFDPDSQDAESNDLKLVEIYGFVIFELPREIAASINEENAPMFRNLQSVLLSCLGMINFSGYDDFFCSFANNVDLSKIEMFESEFSDRFLNFLLQEPNDTSGEFRFVLDFLERVEEKRNNFSINYDKS